MGRRAWQVFTGVFVAAIGVASCSGGSAQGTGAPDGGEAGGSQAEGGHRKDASRDAKSHEKLDAGPDSGTDANGPGASCTGPSDCSSHVCIVDAGGCQAPTPMDGVQNDSETGIDCGGGLLANGQPNPSSDGAPACQNGQSCALGSDCASESCQAGKCVPPTCNDKIQDGQETDVDCGGPVCGACPTGDKCGVAKDCVSDVCTGNRCLAPTDTDGVKNDSETDIDCGGGLLASGQPNASSDGAPACIVGKHCSIGNDCTQGVCGVRSVSADGGLVDAAVADAAKMDAASDGGAVLTCLPPTDTDGVKNDSETDVDCGGALLASGQPNPSSDGAPPCRATKVCVLASDCQSLVCTMGICQSPSATDGVKNDSETDIDCGGGLLASGQPNPSSDGALACIDGKDCVLGTDCKDLVCFAGAVTTPSPDGSPINCPNGQTCTCQKPTFTDGVENDSETDIDCGGDFIAGGQANPLSDGAPLCKYESNQHCLFGTDCDAGVCNANAGAGGGPIDCPEGDTCTCQAPSDTDGVKNDSETDIDCGGALLASGASNPSSDGAPVCATGRGCLLGKDCAEGVCNANAGAGPFTAPIPIDCPNGKTCTCQAAAPNDGVKNDSETDVDCGGKGSANSDNAPACADDLDCKADTDCLSGYCSSLSNKCVAAQSCKGLVAPALANGQHAGLDTCGTGETSDPADQQAHESCCRSLLLPSSTTVRLDKYEVTAGRMRQFVESVNTQMQADGVHNPNGYLYDLRDWATSQVAASTTIGKTLAAQIPAAAFPIFPQSYFNALNIIEAMGATTMDSTYPSALQGCYTNTGAAGASTYWWPGTDPQGIDLTEVGSPPRPYTQDFYDIKAMNCAPYYIYAAFCAWDGGFLPTPAQVLTAYGNGQYPWTPITGSGAPFIPHPYPLQSNGDPNIPNFLTTVNWGNDSFGGKPGDFYFWPNGGTMDTPPAAVNSGLDYSPFIAAPGRFPLDVSTAKSASFGGTEGWQDIGANMMEMMALTSLTGGGSSFCDCGATNGETSNCTCSSSTGGTKPGVTRANNLPSAQWEGGSWEGHSSGNPSSPPYFAFSPYSFPIFTQYGKLGARCARNAEP